MNRVELAPRGRMDGCLRAFLSSPGRKRESPGVRIRWPVVLRGLDLPPTCRQPLRCSAHAMLLSDSFHFGRLDWVGAYQRDASVGQPSSGVRAARTAVSARNEQALNDLERRSHLNVPICGPPLLYCRVQLLAHLASPGEHALPAGKLLTEPTMVTGSRLCHCIHKLVKAINQPNPESLCHCIHKLVKAISQPNPKVFVKKRRV
jgi:hypothetical protein